MLNVSKNKPFPTNSHKKIFLNLMKKISKKQHKTIINNYPCIDQRDWRTIVKYGSGLRIIMMFWCSLSIYSVPWLKDFLSDTNLKRLDQRLNSVFSEFKYEIDNYSDWLICLLFTTEKIIKHFSSSKTLIWPPQIIIQIKWYKFDASKQNSY